MPDYNMVTDGGDTFYAPETPDEPMIIRLYPNTTDRISECESGGRVVNALVDACEQLYDYGSIDYYGIYRYNVENSDLNEPDNYVNWNDIGDSFREFLENDTGTGTNVHNYQGVHQLIHAKKGCDEDSGGYAPAGAGAEHTDDSAFAEGVVAWSPLCSDDGLTKNAAIQETVHCFLLHEVYDDDLTGSENDEHTLGKVGDDWYTSPMLTYHWDDPAEQGDENGGDCPSEHHRAYYHNQSLTWCTKKAVDQTARAKA